MDHVDKDGRFDLAVPSLGKARRASLLGDGLGGATQVPDLRTGQDEGGG